MEHSSAVEVNLLKSAEFHSSYSFNRLEPNFKSHPASTPLDRDGSPNLKSKDVSPRVTDIEKTAQAILNPVQEYAESIKRKSQDETRRSQPLIESAEALQS